jgi:beta-glucanase (GH16 family)
MERPARSRKQHRERESIFTLLLFILSLLPTGMWPYSYNECDSGILKNQTAPGRTGYDSIVSTKKYSRNGLNWLSGMRTPSCTCSDDEHPGPNKNVGRSAPELDILEAQIKGSNQGEASQSLQVAPFDLAYDWDQSAAEIYDNDTSIFNPYTGGVYQEALSVLSPIPDDAYANSGSQFTTFGVEYFPDFNGDGTGSITWYVGGTAMWTVTGASVPPRPEIDIGQRLIPVEPMSIIMNLGISRGFQSDLDFESLIFPAVMKVDYIRVYQNDANAQDLVSCDPADYPTSAYINKYMEVYTNNNHTVWPNDVPANALTTGC